MKYAIVITALTWMWYLVTALRHFVNTRNCVIGRYGQAEFNRQRIKIGLRSLLWILPHKLYYWKEVRWQRRMEEMMEDDDGHK